MNRSQGLKAFSFFLLSALLLVGPSLNAAPLQVPTTLDYLLVGRGPSGTAVATKVSSSNSLGRIYTVPSSANPDVDDPPIWPIPAPGTPPTTGISNDGNVAVTSSAGTYGFSNIDIWADKGIRCDNGVQARCEATWSNSTLTGGTFANDPNEMATIEDELDAAHSTLSGLSPTGSWSVSGDGFKNGSNQWEIAAGLVDTNTVITLGPGQNVIEIKTSGTDFSLNNAHLAIDGPAGSSVVFIMEDEATKNFKFTNASVTIGNSGIEDNAVLFAVLSGSNDTNIDLSKVIVNGIQFWDLSKGGGKITMNNVQGCGQWVGDHLDFNDVQLSLCAHGVPEPASLALLASAPLILLVRRRRA